MSIILPKDVTTVIEFFWEAFSSWTDITSLVVSDFNVEQGISNEDYDNRLADPATVTFQLNNKDNDFPVTTFHKGTLVRCQVTYDGRTRTKFFGTVDDIDIDPGIVGERRLHVTCTDWLNYAINQFVRQRPVEDSKRMDEGIEGLLLEAPIQPLSKLIDSGNTVFPTINDEIDSNTTLYQEMNRLILSEYGYGYMDRGGERLRVENKNARTGLPSIKQLPIDSDGSFLKKADGDYLLLISGDKILLYNSQDADFDVTVNPEVIADLRTVHGKHVLNEIEFVAFPKDLDSSVQPVFGLAEPQFIPEEGSITIEGYFSDPRGGGQISATDFIDPVASTDYVAFANPDGTGSNYTANITITPTYYADRVKFEITNSDVGAWLTVLNLRGIGIYPDNPISVVKGDQSSKDLYGIINLKIVQPYQQSTELGADEAEKILDQEREPREVALSMTCIAHASPLNMLAFLHCDIGDLIHIKTTKPALDSYYYINGMKWRIDWATKIIYYTYILKEYPSFSMIAVEYPNVSGSEAGFDFLRPVELNNVSPCTFFVRIYQKSLSANNTPIMGKYSGSIRKALFLRSDGKMTWVQGFSTGTGQWDSDAEVFDSYIDEWTTVAVTYNASNAANDPIFYINGASVAFTEVSTPAGIALDDSGIKFLLNNGSYPSNEWVYKSDTVCKDYRVYNRILSAAEIADLDANDDPNYNTVGLVFQAPFVRNFRVDDYINNSISTEMKIFDRVNPLTGTVHFNSASTDNYVLGRDPDDTSF